MAGPRIQLLIATLLLAVSALACAKNCGCVQGICYNKYVYCGNVCQSEPCNLPLSDDGVYVEDLVTQQFFDSIIDLAGSRCEGKGFYTREAFLDAISEKYPSFEQDFSTNDSKREIAAFFAHITHETRYFCYIEERDKSNSYCDTSYLQYPCIPSKMYYGRGPLQISWNYNYAMAGQDIGFDGLNLPEIVSDDVVISFKTALWFWENNVHGVVSQGFGATIRAINGALECDGGNQAAQNDRIKIYINYCDQFGVSPGDNLYC